jgi:predicted nucleotidyltransferase
MEESKKNLEEYLEKREQEINQRRNMLLNRLQLVAEKLPETFPSIRRIVVIGSLTKPIFFSLHSDVDIVITGLENKRFFEAYLYIEELLGLEDIHLIREEDASQLLMKKIEEGIVLYEKQK